MEIVVGTIIKAHGVRGEVVVQLHTDEPDRRFTSGRVLGVAGRADVALKVVSVKAAAGRLVVGFAGVVDRDAADAVRGWVLTADVPEDETPDEPEEYYDRQLIGLMVLRADGQPAGEVSAVLHQGVQDLLVVTTMAGERLVPFVSALVPEVNLKAGTLTLADVGGLLEDIE
ncbi:MAG: ribosome maturation factor RimM [Propionibacteriaceae bacterium]|jgi:16S rRNA processing protein RimM|nr:ribosome maturation factor RimM [Propionibacteriaceae bacterium]